MSKRKPGFGKQLIELHRWNAWIVAILAVSGLLLAWGALRGLGAGRIWIQQLHIAIGIVSGILILLYLPLAARHVKQLGKRPKQRGNLWIVLALLIGWLVSGVVLWQLRQFPPRWGNHARLVHELLTYIGLPYILYHSITRLKWMKQPARRAIRSAEPADGDLGIANGGPSTKIGTGSGTGGESKTTGVSASSRDGVGNIAASPTGSKRSYPGMSWGDAAESAAAAGRHVGPPAPGPWLDRRQFLKVSLGVAMAAVVLPPFFRWFRSLPSATGIASVGGQTTADNPNQMLPDPLPLPDSANVIGGGARGRFQVYTVTRLPVFSSDTWRFTLDGLVDRPASWTWEQFLDLARKVQVSDFHCVTGWSVYQNTWEGIPLSQLLKEAGVKPQASHVKFYSGDGVYTDALSLEQAYMDDVMVAVLHDGKPIHRDYGGPARLIVPRMYAYKSVKWLDRIELIDQEHIGYWEERGYDNNAWIKGQGVPL